jgi:PPOX class probable F420-dependent enzyme
MDLDRELGSYISLATFRRDGTPVETAVWFAECAGKLYVFTEGGSFKVKRLRRNAQVRVARCGALGRITGEWLNGRARIIESGPTEDAAYAALRGKYGWQMRLIDVMSRLAGRFDDRVILEISLDGTAAATGP